MSQQTYTHLTLEERWQIKALRESGKSMRAIAHQRVPERYRTFRAALIPVVEKARVLLLEQKKERERDMQIQQEKDAQRQRKHKDRGMDLGM
jgi:hypothetical protein